MVNEASVSMLVDINGPSDFDDDLETSVQLQNCQCWGFDVGQGTLPAANDQSPLMVNEASVSMLVDINGPSDFDDDLQTSVQLQ
ncbi:unnamed protein product [Cyprideis torosa]|uniref:Uncharacterized protein n=1 Tax=Cyprideis torosa TaxID=163714 RepID=A0A7R8ZXI9_9CRUS|nr:unnamed protein product [Cyprideis torosa]CAG0906895.1 unnamed protein product [Cyprideis torosa]